MAANKRFATLNLGMQTVTMAVFEVVPGNSIQLCEVARAGLQPDPSLDSSRAGQLQILLTELRSKLKWYSGPAAIALPSQGVFARLVKIPKVEPEKVGQMLLFEAQQNVPFPIEEVSWTYQVIPESESDKMGALILATKLDEMEATVAAVQSAGFAPDFLETSPVALYNALRYNYPELSGCTLLIDIGARATNLVFAEQERLFFRTLPMGGSSITALLQKKFEARPFADIEEFKIKEGFIPPSGSHQGSDDIVEMGKVARTVMTRVHNEVTRSVTHYRTNQNGSAPLRVFLAGGGASLPWAAEFFHEKLSLPVEFFNPLRRVPVASNASSAEIGANAHALGECVGLAASAMTSDCPLTLRFNSPRLEAARRNKQRPPLLAAAVALLVCALSLAFFHYKNAAARLLERGQEFDNAIGQLQQFKTRIDYADSQRKQVMEEAADLIAAPTLQTAWVTILDEVSQLMPPRNIWITRLRPMSGDVVLSRSDKQEGSWEAETGRSDHAVEKDKTMAVTAIAIDGLYLENDKGPAVVDAFVDSLAQSDIFAVDPARKNDAVKLRAAQSGENWAYDYKLVLPLRRPIPL